MDDGKARLGGQNEAGSRAPRGRVLPPAVTVGVLATLIAGLSGPFGTFAMFSVEIRLAFWAAFIAVSVATLIVWRKLMVRLIGPGRQWLFDMAMLLGMGVSVFLYAMGLQQVFAGFAQEPLFGAPRIARDVTLTILVVYCIRRLWPGLEDPRHTLALARLAEPIAPPRVRLMERLPGDIGTILRLEARGHFVRVVATNREVQLRMRLGDAVDEIEGLPGLCTHRSHWVAKDAVAGAEREAGKVWLCLSNGDRVPVSRKYQPQVAAAGWLD